MLYAGVVELADTIDLGSIAFACRFKSCHPHQNEIGDFVYEYFRFAKIHRGLFVNATDLLKAASQNVAVIWEI